MAILKMGAIVTGIKGKQGGTVFQGGTAGQTMKSGPVNKGSQIVKDYWNSGPQNNDKGCRMSNNPINSILSIAADDPSITGVVFYDGSRNGWVGPTNQQTIVATLSSAWRNLTNSQRATWSTGAINYPFHNKFGDVYTGSGYQVYMQLNTNLLQAFQSPLSECPTPAETPLPTIETDWADENKAAMMLLQFPAGITAGTMVQVFASPVRSAGRNSNLNQQLIASIPAGAAKNVQLLYAYQYSKGFVPLNGNIVFTISVINLTTGVQTVMQTLKLKTVFGGKGQRVMLATDTSAWVPVLLPQTVNFGNVGVSSSVELDKLLFVNQIGDPWTITLGGADPTDFDFEFNGNLPIGGVISGGCDVFGNMVGFRLKVIAQPASLGVKGATLTFNCPALGLTAVLTLACTGV